MVVCTLTSDSVTTLHLQNVFKLKLFTEGTVIDHRLLGLGILKVVSSVLLGGRRFWPVSKWGSFYSSINPFFQLAAVLLGLS